MSLLGQFDSLFDLGRDRWPLGTGISRAFVPPADLIVTADEVTVVMDVPGLTPDTLEIELNGDALTVRGERAYPHGPGDEGRTWYRFERGYGKFQRVIQVPKGLDPDKVSASMADGVLTLHIPQPEAAKPHRIEIATAGGPAHDAPADGPTELNGHRPAAARELAGAAA